MSFLVHIGYPKSASTFLQRGLFSGRHPAIDPWQLPPPAPRQGGKSAITVFDHPGPGTAASGNLVSPFSFDPQAARRILLAGQSPDKPVTVLSNEILVGHPYTGGLGAETLGRRIHAALPEAKVLIVIREQREMLFSAYSNYLRRDGGTARLERYLAPRKADQIPGHSPEYYGFSALVEWYVATFGAGQVLVLPVELLGRAPQDFVAAIERFLELPAEAAPVTVKRANVGDPRSHAVLSLLPRLNALGKPTTANGGGALGLPGLRGALLTGLRALLPGAVRDARRARDMALIEAQLAPLIGPDNTRLQRHVAQDLAELGYLLA